MTGLLVGAALLVVLGLLVVASVWLGMIVEAQRAIDRDRRPEPAPTRPAAEIIDLRYGSDGVWTADQ